MTREGLEPCCSLWDRPRGSVSAGVAGESLVMQAPVLGQQRHHLSMGKGKTKHTDHKPRALQGLPPVISR